MSQNNYTKVRKELMDGNSFLMLPAPGKNEAIPENWNISSESSRMQLSSLYTIDGIKVLSQVHNLTIHVSGDLFEKPL